MAEIGPIKNLKFLQISLQFPGVTWQILNDLCHTGLRCHILPLKWPPQNQSVDINEKTMFLHPLPHEVIQHILELPGGLSQLLHLFYLKLQFDTVALQQLCMDAALHGGLQHKLQRLLVKMLGVSITIFILIFYISCHQCSSYLYSLSSFYQFR